MGSIWKTLKEEYGDNKPESVEEAWQTLMDIVVFHLGYAPRDVFFGMTQLEPTKDRHLRALKVSPSQLQEIVVTFKHRGQFPNDDSEITHNVVAVSPRSRRSDNCVIWGIDFKSLWIAKAVSRRLMEAQENEARQLISIFKDIPAATSMLGHMLEPFLHRLLTTAEPEGNPWPLLEMQSNDVTHAPTFSVDPFSTAASGTQSFPCLQRKVERIGSRIPTPLAQGTYYIPQKTFPLIDAFTVEIDKANFAAVLWLLQVTPPKDHDGLGRGYTWIRQLITAVQDELESHLWDDSTSSSERPPSKQLMGSAEVSVRYVLVRPTSEDSASWKMPEGWDVCTTKVDHRGPVYLLQASMEGIFHPAT